MNMLRKQHDQLVVTLSTTKGEPLLFVPCELAYLRLDLGFHNTHDPDRYLVVETALKQTLHGLILLSKVWRVGFFTL